MLLRRGARRRSETDLGRGRWVVAFNRDRDGYQVPLALYEVDKLSALVTDYYSGRWPPLRRLAHRRVEGLPAAKVRNSLLALALQALPLGQFGKGRFIFPLVDNWLSFRTAVLLWRGGGPALIYSGYGRLAFAAAKRRPRNTSLGVFVFHPQPAASAALLLADFDVNPSVVGWSIHNDREVHNWQVAERLRRSELSNADFVIVASAFTARTVRASGYTGPISVVPYGVGASAHAAPPRRDGPLRLLFVGQGVQRKGLHHLFQALRSNASVRLTAVSSTVDPGIRAIAPDNVTWAANLSALDLQRAYESHDALVLPSLVEGFGLVIPEALAAGCHVITTENTGIADLDLTGAGTSIVPVGDIVALANAINSLAAAKAGGTMQYTDALLFRSNNSWERFRAGIQAVVNGIEQQNA